METIKKNVKVGKYLIKNVPQTVMMKNHKTIYHIEPPTYMALGEIIEFLEKSEMTTFDYEGWLNLWKTD